MMTHEHPDDQHAVPAASGPTAEEPTRLSPSREARTVLPLRALRELLDEDEDALHEALATFLESIADVRAGVRAAIEVHDIDALAFHAHRFKSAAGQIEAAECYRLCALFKDLPREAEPAVQRQAERLVAELLAALDELEPDIRHTMASLKA